MFPRAFSLRHSGSSAASVKRWHHSHRIGRHFHAAPPTATNQRGAHGEDASRGGGHGPRWRAQQSKQPWQQPPLRLTALAAAAAFVSTATPIAEPGSTGASSPFRLVSGVSYRPDPGKANKAGEDAHFVSDDGLAVGVADGVGGWSDSGVDAGVYARLLMSQAASALQEPIDSVVKLLGAELAKTVPEPLRVMLLAHSRTIVRGSSTACVVLLRGNELQVANLGDSGFAILRDGRLLFKSPPQQHRFNFPYQIGAYRGGDSPLDAQNFRADVKLGDVLIVATDGLWDNVFMEEVTSIVSTALRAGRSPGDAAQELVNLAHERGHSKTARTPFSVEAMRNRVVFVGGKLDDTTVIVSVVKEAPHVAPPSTPPR